MGTISTNGRSAISHPWCCAIAITPRLSSGESAMRSPSWKSSSGQTIGRVIGRPGTLARYFAAVDTRLSRHHHRAERRRRVLSQLGHYRLQLQPDSDLCGRTTPSCLNGSCSTTESYPAKAFPLWQISQDNSLCFGRPHLDGYGLPGRVGDRSLVLWDPGTGADGATGHGRDGQIAR